MEEMTQKVTHLQIHLNKRCLYYELLNLYKTLQKKYIPPTNNVQATFYHN